MKKISILIVTRYETEFITCAESYGLQ